MAFPRKLKELCTPAYIYFLLSMAGIVISVVQNLGDNRRYVMGMYSTRVPNTIVVFIVKMIYIFFWTWMLNLMCRDGHKEIAWFLVLVPFILLFVIMALLFVNIEGNENMCMTTTKEALDRAHAEYTTCISTNATNPTMCAEKKTALVSAQKAYDDCLNAQNGTPVTSVPTNAPIPPMIN
jgi:hypothetical protein